MLKVSYYWQYLSFHILFGVIPMKVMFLSVCYFHIYFQLSKLLQLRPMKKIAISDLNATLKKVSLEYLLMLNIMLLFIELYPYHDKHCKTSIVCNIGFSLLPPVL